MELQKKKLTNQMSNKKLFQNQLEQLLLYDRKWKELKKLSNYFRYIPFIDFVIVSGSMATGNITKYSDFDVLISVKENRLFFTRYLINFFFGILKKRRTNDFKNSSPNKLCFNHFITRPVWKLKPVDNYGPIIYSNLIPLYGNKNKIKKFFQINSQYNPQLVNHLLDLRYNCRQPKLITYFIEKILSGKIGDWLEKISFFISSKRLSNYLKSIPNKNGRIIINKHELEFHFQHK